MSEDKNAKVNQEFKKLVEDSLRDTLRDGTIVVRQLELQQYPANCGIYLQWWISQENKAYLELDYSDQFKHKYDKDDIADGVIRYLHSNFHYDINVWDETVMPEDGVNEVCDSSDILTPYVISYWKSMSGRYEFLTDRVKVTHDAEIYQMGLDIKPEKSFNDFIDQVKLLRAKYSQPILSESQKTKYFEEYGKLITKYSSDKDQFDKELDKLKKKYNLYNGNLNDKIPEIFDEYKKLYKEYFKKDLYVADSHKVFIEVLNKKG